VPEPVANIAQRPSVTQHALFPLPNGNVKRQLTMSDYNGTAILSPEVREIHHLPPGPPAPTVFIAQQLPIPPPMIPPSNADFEEDKKFDAPAEEAKAAQVHTYVARPATNAAQRL
jgi:hypothetical protein